MISLDLDKLAKARINIDLAWFQKTFKGNKICSIEHLWHQFSSTYRSDIPSFWKYLGGDYDLKEMFLKGLNEIEV